MDFGIELGRRVGKNASRRAGVLYSGPTDLHQRPAVPGVRARRSSRQLVLSGGGKKKKSTRCIGGPGRISTRPSTQTASSAERGPPPLSRTWWFRHAAKQTRTIIFLMGGMHPAFTTCGLTKRRHGRPRRSQDRRARGPPLPRRCFSHRAHLSFFQMEDHAAPGVSTRPWDGWDAGHSPSL